VALPLTIGIMGVGAIGILKTSGQRDRSACLCQVFNGLRSA